MTQNEIREQLFRQQDKEYAAMQIKILPTVKADRIIGVRTPALRAFGKVLYRDENRDAKRFFRILTIGQPVISYLPKPSKRTRKGCCHMSGNGFRQRKSIRYVLPSAC